MADHGTNPIGTTRLGTSDLAVSRLCLGGNVFGWKADEAASFAVLDGYAAAGGNFVDTADSYSLWADGHVGGESETILGRWLAARGKRDDIVLATKGSRLPPHTGLSGPAVRGAAEDSLRRLCVDHIDLYYAHFDDPETPVEETVAAYDELVRAGKVRHVAASNLPVERIVASLDFARREGMAEYVAVQPHYNLVERETYERDLAGVVADRGLSTVPYYGLAKGFLTGKYRDGAPLPDSPRAGAAASYLDHRGRNVLAALDAVAADRDTSVTAVALAWLAAQPTVAAPIASARDTAQLTDLLAGARLRLDDGALRSLTAASN